MELLIIDGTGLVLLLDWVVSWLFHYEVLLFLRSGITLRYMFSLVNVVCIGSSMALVLVYSSIGVPFVVVVACLIFGGGCS